jgi:hypothetical protein
MLLTYEMTNSLMELSPPWDAANCAAILKKFPAFYGTRKFITVFTVSVTRSVLECFNRLRKVSVLTQPGTDMHTDSTGGKSSFHSFRNFNF